MAAMSRAQQMKQLVPGLNAIFGMTYETYEDEHLELYDTENSERAFEEETKLAGFDAAPVKQEGGAHIYDSGQEVWTARYNHETIVMGFSFTQEAMEDNLYEQLGQRYTKALARSMNYTKQVKAAYPFNNGFGSYTVGDGQPLFDAAHPLLDGSSNANEPTTAADLNETSLEAAVIDIAAWTDERGLLIAAKPRKLAIPTNLMFVAERILTSNLRVGTADNDPNALKQMGSIPEGYCVNHFFTDTDAWFLKTDIPNGAKHFVRVALSTDMDGDFDTGNTRYKARERYSFGFSDPLAYYASPGAA